MTNAKLCVKNLFMTSVHRKPTSDPLAPKEPKRKATQPLYEDYPAKYYLALHAGEDAPHVPHSDVVYIRAAIEAKTGQRLSLESVRTLMKEELRA